MMPGKINGHDCEQQAALTYNSHLFAKKYPATNIPNYQQKPASLILGNTKMQNKIMFSLIKKFFVSAQITKYFDRIQFLRMFFFSGRTLLR